MNHRPLDGDADLSGVVTIVDFARLAANFNRAVAAPPPAARPASPSGPFGHRPVELLELTPH